MRLFNKKGRYLERKKIQDVIQLITVLGTIEGGGFETEKRLQEAIRSKPLTRKTWFEVALEHPEFFRPNGDRTHLALLMRSYQPIIEDGKKEGNRVTLTIAETQDLINVALELHDREIIRKQRNSYLFPIIVAIISALALIGVTYYSNHNTHNNFKEVQDSIQQLKQSIIQHK